MQNLNHLSTLIDPVVLDILESAWLDPDWKPQRGLSRRHRSPIRRKRGKRHQH